MGSRERGAVLSGYSGWLSSMTLRVSRRFLAALDPSRESSLGEEGFWRDGVGCFELVGFGSAESEACDTSFVRTRTSAEDFRFLLVWRRRVGVVSVFIGGRACDGVYSDVWVSGFPACWGVAVERRDDALLRVANNQHTYEIKTYQIEGFCFQQGWEYFGSRLD